MPDLVASDLLIQANSFDQFVRPAAWRLAGPAIGGFLVAWSTGGAFLVDAATFAISIVALLFMSPHPIDAPTDAGPPRRSRTSEKGSGSCGTGVVVGNAARRRVRLPAVHRAAGGPAATAREGQLGRQPADLGFILAMGGVGAIGAALYMGQRAVAPSIHHVHVRRLDAVDPRGRGLRAGARPLAGMVACFLFNALETAGTIVWATTKQRLVPRRLLGRVSSLDWFISIGLLPLSFALTGPVANLFGARATLIGAGVLGAIVTFVVPVPPRHARRSSGDPPEGTTLRAEEVDRRPPPSGRPPRPEPSV